MSNQGREAAVSIMPGHTAAMKMPRRASSSRRCRAIVLIAETWAIFDGALMNWVHHAHNRATTSKQQRRTAKGAPGSS
jgi:hypothetical protein